MATASSLHDNFITAAYKSVTLRYHIDNRLIDLPVILKTIGHRQSRLHKTLGIDTAAMEIEIEVYSDREEWIEHHTYLYGGDMPSWVQADSGRIIRVTIDDHKISGLDQLLMIIDHETIHHSLKYHTGHIIPAWLDEGLALYLSQELPDHYTRVLSRSMGSNTVLPFEMLNAPFTAFDRKVKTLAYAQSYTMVAHIVKTHGWEMIKALLDAVARKENPQRALMRFGLNFYLLESEWKRSLHGL